MFTKTGIFGMPVLAFLIAQGVSSARCETFPSNPVLYKAPSAPFSAPVAAMPPVNAAQSTGSAMTTVSDGGIVGQLGSADSGLSLDELISAPKAVGATYMAKTDRAVAGTTPARHVSSNKMRVVQLGRDRHWRPPAAGPIFMIGIGY